MPINWDDEQVYKAAYSIHDWENGGVRITYGSRYGFLADDDFSKRYQSLFDRNLVTPSDTHLIVGCGFGFLLNKLLTAWPNESIYGTDISSFIQADKNVEAPSLAIADRILNIDITSPTAASQFQAAGAGNQGGNPANRGKFSGIICTELVLESYNDNPDPSLDTGLQAILSACEELSAGGAIAHIVSVLPANNAPDQRKMTLEEWAALRPSHYWIAVNERDPNDFNKLRVIEPV